MKRISFLIALVVLLFLASSILAMDSENYRLDWFTPMTGSGGMTDSTNYAASFTVGQTTIGNSSSVNYESCLGYWCGVDTEYYIYLPLAFRNS